MTTFHIGKVTHYYSQLKVAVLALDEELRIGDFVFIQGRTTHFHQKVTSLEINHHQVDSAAVGSEVAMKVIKRVRKNDRVYQSTEEETQLSSEEELIDAWQ